MNQMDREEIKKIIKEYEEEKNSPDREFIKRTLNQIRDGICILFSFLNTFPDVIDEQKKNDISNELIYDTELIEETINFLNNDIKQNKK